MPNYSLQRILRHAQNRSFGILRTSPSTDSGPLISSVSLEEFMKEKRRTSNGKTKRVYVYTTLTCFVWGAAFAYVKLWVDHQPIPPVVNMIGLIFLSSLGCFIVLIFAFKLGIPLPAGGREHHLLLYPAIAVPIVLVGLEVRNWMLWGRSLFFE